MTAGQPPSLLLTSKTHSVAFCYAALRSLPQGPCLQVRVQCSATPSYHAEAAARRKAAACGKWGAMNRKHRAADSVCSLPPCGGWLGRGVSLAGLGRKEPPPLAPPRKGEGNT